MFKSLTKNQWVRLFINSLGLDLCVLGLYAQDFSYGFYDFDEFYLLQVFSVACTVMFGIATIKSVMNILKDKK